MEPLGQTTSHSSPQPIEETSVKGSKQQTSHRTINEKISALWKSITDRLEIPKPLRKFFATLYDYGSEVQKRIGYILRQILPNLFFSNTVFKAVEKPIVSGPSKGGQENLRILLTRQLTNGKEEEILNFEDLLITHQVNEDIPRTFWPLSYCKDRNTTPSVCADSQKRDASIDPNKRKISILNWLRTTVLLDSTTNMPQDKLSQQQALMNLTTLIFHQGMCADVVQPLMTQNKAIVKQSQYFHENASLSSTKNTLKIELTWNFNVISDPLDASESAKVIGTQKVIRTIQIPWAELIADWAQASPKNPRFTVEDTIYPLVKV